MTTRVSEILAAAGWTTHRHLIAGWGTEHTAQHPLTRRTVIVSPPSQGHLEVHLCRVTPEQAETIAQVLAGRIEEALTLAHGLVQAWEADHPSEAVRQQAIGLLAGTLSGALAELGRGSETPAGGAR